MLTLARDADCQVYHNSRSTAHTSQPALSAPQTAEQVLPVALATHAPDCRPAQLLPTHGAQVAFVRRVLACNETVYGSIATRTASGESRWHPKIRGQGLPALATPTAPRLPAKAVAKVGLLACLERDRKSVV